MYVGGRFNMLNDYSHVFIVLCLFFRFLALKQILHPLVVCSLITGGSSFGLGVARKLSLEKALEGEDERGAEGELQSLWHAPFLVCCCIHTCFVCV